MKYVCNSFHASRLTFYVEKLNREQDATLRFALGKLRRNCSKMNRNLNGASQKKKNRNTKAGYIITYKKNLPVYTNRLVIENGLSNFYQSPNPFLNAISIILSNPVYTFDGVLFISPVAERLKK